LLRIGESDVHYLQLTLNAPPDRKGLVVWIPHRYVVLGFGDEQDRKIGFLDTY